MAEAEDMLMQLRAQVQEIVRQLRRIGQGLAQRYRMRAAMEYVRNARQHNADLDRAIDNENPERSEQWQEREREIQELEAEAARLEEQRVELQAEIDRIEQEQRDRQQAELEDRNGDGISDELRDPRDLDGNSRDDAVEHRDQVAADNARAADVDGDGRLDVDERADERAAENAAEDERDTRADRDQQADTRAEQDQEAETRAEEGDRDQRVRQAREEDRERQERRDQPGVDAATPVAAAGTAAVVADELDDREEQQAAERNETEPDREEQRQADEPDREFTEADGTVPGGVIGGEAGREQEESREFTDADGTVPGGVVGADREQAEAARVDGQTFVVGDQGVVSAEETQDGRQVAQAEPQAGQDAQQTGQDARQQPGLTAQGPNVENVGPGQLRINGQDYSPEQAERPVQQAINDHKALHQSTRGGQQQPATPPNQKSVDEMRRTQDLVNSGQSGAAGATSPNAGQAGLDGARTGKHAGALHKDSVNRGGRDGHGPEKG